MRASCGPPAAPRRVSGEGSARHGSEQATERERSTDHAKRNARALFAHRRAKEAAKPVQANRPVAVCREYQQSAAMSVTAVPIQCSLPKYSPLMLIIATISSTPLHATARRSNPGDDAAGLACAEASDGAVFMAADSGRVCEMSHPGLCLTARRRCGKQLTGRQSIGIAAVAALTERSQRLACIVCSFRELLRVFNVSRSTSRRAARLRPQADQSLAAVSDDSCCTPGSHTDRPGSLAMAPRCRAPEVRSEFQRSGDQSRRGFRHPDRTGSTPYY